MDSGDENTQQAPPVKEGAGPAKKGAVAAPLPRWSILLWPARWLEAHLEVIRYVYLLRFSILLWFLLFLLPGLDYVGITTAVTHGMFALSGFGQFVAVGFYVVLTGWMALLSARVICAYGKARFDTPPPQSLTIKDNMSWKTLLAAQIPGAFFLWYVAAVSAVESGSNSDLEAAKASCLVCKEIGNAGVLLLGGVFAFYAWYMVAFFYGLLRTPPVPKSAASKPADPNGLFHDDTFHAFVSPQARWLHLDIALKDDIKPPKAPWMVAGFGDLAQILGPGYQKDLPLQHELHTGHILTIILYLFLLAIYAIVGFLTWPGHPWHIYIVGGVLALAILGFLALVTLPKTNQPNSRLYRLVILAISMVAVALFAQTLRGNYFPVLASILVLVHSLYWLGAGFAFWADRFRIPVVTLLLIILLLGSKFVSLDHFYPTLETKKIESPTPAEVLRRYKDHHAKNNDKDPTKQAQGDDPMIVVTASGGGIHSAVWTAKVLDGLEQAFQKEHKVFHQHILLMSSVSGGSVATSYWAEQYLDATPHPEAFSSAGVVGYTECSSLEAAAWGVIYPDLNDILVWKNLLLRPWVMYDRGWALQTALARNREADCRWNTTDQWGGNGLPDQDKDYRLTTLREATRQGAAPAFAFNTTLVYGGLRFLLSSYSLKDVEAPACGPGLTTGDPACPPTPTPAQDFLTTCPTLDVSLFTAARLSATFTYVTPVSVAAPPPGKKPTCDNDFCYRQHLADGGYYDNDGMASAMEFIWYAYKNKETGPVTKPKVDTDPSKSGAVSGSSRETKNPDYIYLIEIRNDEEPGPPGDPSKPPLGNVVEQTTAPITTLMGAWGVAQPMRNQREFTLLKSTLRDKVKFEHIVFAYKKTEPGEKDPLSWHLTKSDKEKIDYEWENDYRSNAENLAEHFAPLPPPKSPQH